MDFVLNNIELIIGAVIAIIIICILMSGYVKASPDVAYIISGMGKKPRILRGRAGIKIPFLEKKDELIMNLVPVDVKTSSAVPTADYININVDSAVNVKVSTKEELLLLAAQNFLNKDSKYIGGVAREVLEGNMREIVGRMNLEEMVSDRQKFAELVKENAEPDLAKMGLEIVSFNVQNFTDGNGVIENLGVDNVVRIQKNAAITRAESEKEIKVAQARNAQESNNAQVEAESAIAAKKNELEIKKANLKIESDVKKAEADAAYQIQSEEQRKTIEIKTVDANIARQQREIELRKAEAQVAEEALNAEVKKKADADKYRREREAEAALIEKQKEAEADLAMAKREAESEKLRAEATKYSKEMEAQGIRAMGEAEAAAIKAKGEAEAAAMEKKAEAYKKYGQAAITEMIVGILPEMAEKVASAVSTIDKVTIIDSGNGQSGVESVGGWAPGILAKTIESVKETTGFDLTEVMKSGTYDAKVNRNINIDGIGEHACDGECDHHCNGHCDHKETEAVKGCAP